MPAYFTAVTTLCILNSHAKNNSKKYLRCILITDYLRTYEILRSAKKGKANKRELVKTSMN